MIRGARAIVAATGLILGCTAFAAVPPGVSFGGPLHCPMPSRAVTVYVATAVAMQGMQGNLQDRRFLQELMAEMHLTAPWPEGSAAAIADLAAAQVRSGNIVAAKMLHDGARAAVAAYRDAQFADAFQNTLTFLTAPVMHTGGPGAQEHRDGSGSLDAASKGLHEILRDVGLAQRALGERYREPAVRYYILATAFRDPVALKAATNLVCGLGMSETSRDVLDKAAAFVGVRRADERLGALSSLERAAGSTQGAKQ